MTRAAISARPSIDPSRAGSLAKEVYGVVGPVRELGSQQDRNFLIDSPGGRAVLKVANRGWGRAAASAQNAALRHLADAGVDFAAPVPIPGLDGATLHGVRDGEDVLPLRLLTYVDGTQIGESGHLAPAVVADLGALAGRVSAALSGFDHPGLDRVVQWDLRRAGEVVDLLLGSIADPGRRALVAGIAARASERLGPIAPRLRIQAIHGDLTDDNIVGDRDDAGRVRPNGVIDFGDLNRGWVVADLAVTCSSVLRHHGDDPLRVLPAVRAFHEVVELTDDDVAALWPLVVLRAAVLVVSSEHQIVLDPGNEGLAGPLEQEWGIVDAARAIDLDLAEAAIRSALGWGVAGRYRAAHEVARGAGRLLAATPRVVDLSVTGDAMHSGRFLDPTTEASVLDAAAGRTGAASSRWAEPRLTRTMLDSAQEPAATALGIDLAVTAGTAVHAPWDGVVADMSGECLAFDHDSGLRLSVLGIRPAVVAGARVSAGSALGSADEDPLWIQLRVDSSIEAPRFATATAATGWTALCPDPSPLLGTDVAMPREDAQELLRRRRTALAAVQESYYERPMRIERGWRHYLFDTAGRCYVDLVNNVAAVGHGHPRVADAVERQLRTLNTNSRFHYGALTEFSERLAALAPAGLDQVFLVNSGSEAVDLALRMAQTVTGRQDVVAVREAYHGWTALSDAVTTSLYDNAAALDSRPDWVHLASAPNPFRGPFRGSAAGNYAIEIRDLVSRMSTRGHPPAAFICEPLLGNAGGVLLPQGYLAAAYQAIREVGGLTIADEVQVGYGRTGYQWWAFQMHAVTPDFITVAKAMGNGHPLGAVITTREIAEGFRAAGSFFSSTGGSPVSCVTGMAVLDIIGDEALQANAAAVGDRIIADCTALMARHRIVGAVHGMGLYLGIELVRDRESLEPATAECYAICERLRELGVIVQPTGERANVLKIKPPMCITGDTADFVVAMIDRVLREGW